MSTINIFRDTVIAAGTIAENLFVGTDGAVGGDYGVTEYGGESGKPMDVLVSGVAEVKLAAGQTVAAGDYVKPDGSGKAVKDNANGRFRVKKGGTGEDTLVEVVCGGLPSSFQFAQATTGTTGGGDAGEVAVTGLTAATGKVLVVPAEDPGDDLAFSHVVVADGKFTVYVKDVTGTTPVSAAALEGKAVNYLVLSY